MPLHHGVLAHDGQSLDGQPYLAGDPITINDDGDHGALVVTNHRTHGLMLVSVSSACWIPSYVENTPDDTILWTLYGETHPSEAIQQSTPGTGRKSIQVSVGSAFDVRRACVSDEDFLDRTRALQSAEQNAFFSWHWAKMTAPRQPCDREDASDGGLSTGCSSPSSIHSPVTPLTFARHDSVVDLGSLDRSKGNQDPGIIEAGSFSTDQLPAASSPFGPTTQIEASNVFAKTAAPLHGTVKYPDLSALYPQLFGLQDGYNPQYSLYPYGGVDQTDLARYMTTNTVQVNYMFNSPQGQQNQAQAPTTANSPASHGVPQWNPSVPAPSAEWQAAYAAQGLAPAVAGSGHAAEQLGPMQQYPGSNPMREAYRPSHPVLLSNPHRHLAPGQRSLINQSWALEMPGSTTEPIFVRTQEHHEMNLTASSSRSYGPASQSPGGSRPSRSQGASHGAREPEPQPTSEFRPDLVLNSFRHQIRPDIDVLQRAARGDADGKPASTFVDEALKLVQSTADETIGILETLRPGAEWAGSFSQTSIRNHVNHILAGIQTVRQSAMDSRELAEDDRKELSKQVESLKALVGRLANLNADVMRETPRSRAAASSGSQASVAAFESDMSRTGATGAHPTAATMALRSFHWGQTTPPPDQPPRMAIAHGHHQASPFLHHGMPSHVTNPHQAMLLSRAAPLPGFGPSGCHVDPALSGVTHPVMAPVMSPPTGAGPVTAAGWVPYPALHPAVSASPTSTFPPQQWLPMGLMPPSIYPSPPQPDYGEGLASMYEATHGPLPSQVSETGVSLAAAAGPVMAHASSFSSHVAGLGPSPDAQIFPGPMSVMSSPVGPSAGAHDSHPLSNQMASGRRGSVPDRRLPPRDRSRLAPYPVDYRSSSGRKGSV